MGFFPETRNRETKVIYMQVENRVEPTKQFIKLTNVASERSQTIPKKLYQG